MELKLQLSVFVLLIHVSFAMWQRVTVQKGQTLHLSCPITNAHKTSVDWKNPQGFLMFFNQNKALKDKRYRIERLSISEFAISISNVTFKDGGIYTCSQYDHQITEKQVEVTVLSLPKMTVTKHDGKFVIKCTAEANHHPPQISWKLDHGPEILAYAKVQHEDKNKYISTDMIHVDSVENRVAVKCLVRHPALLSGPLINFIKIGRDTSKFHRTSTTSSPTPQPQGSTGLPGTTTSWFRHGRTRVYLTTRSVNRPSSESTTQLSAVPSSHPFSSNRPKTVTAPTHFPRDSVISTDSHLSTSGWTPVSETTEEIISNNSTERNRTGSINDTRTQTGSEGSSLLVFLVTCLIFGLLVVVIFIAIKLRRAHITWKRENEESDPSEESSKSKSSQEERNSKGQRRRGLFNTAFTKYTVEDPTVINAGAMTATESVNKDQTSQPQTSAKSDVKETEL
ncbi:cytotoxic and regulatory T-cell molecule isoform X2 [Trachinotus anak]|uniref:cytotoxic and regulatory T-cell molecule isoform X2 n=1 Tax=Trachinotus anak TaxID=443729 RepID=UPI0039F1850F